MTTITIDDRTKEELLKIAAQLQIQLRRKVNYNMAIKHLISNYNKKKDKAKLKRACKYIEGINLDQVLDELYSERKKDEISF